MSAYLLPGMGGDSSMYGPAFRALPGAVYPNWPKYGNERTVSELAASVIAEQGIGPADVVGGTSLGGIVAAEIAALADVRKLVLMGSTLTPASINPMLKQLSLLSDITPLDLMRAFADKASSIRESRVLSMFSRSDSQFIRAMAKAVFTWPGNPRPRCGVVHIHGARDRVIYPPAFGARILSDGGHLLTLTHEAAVARFILPYVTD